MNPNVLVFPIYDPNFKVESQNHYALLVQRMIEITLELQEEYPDNEVVAVYVCEK